MPRVSIVIPTLNAGRTLRVCLAAARSQTHRDVEIIVVDSMSKDETAEIARQADQLIRVDSGMTKARLLGVRAARGDYVLNLDSDQVLARDTVSRALQASAEGADVLVLGETSVGPGLVARINALDQRFTDVHWQENVDVIAGVLRPRFYRTPVVLRALEAIPPGLIDQRPCPFSEDTLVYFFAARAHPRIGYVPGAVTHIEEESIWTYMKKWAGYGRAAKGIRGTELEVILNNRGVRRGGGLRALPSYAALAVRALPFAMGLYL